MQTFLVAASLWVTQVPPPADAAVRPEPGGPPPASALAPAASPLAPAAASALHGTVVEAESGTPISGAVVELRDLRLSASTDSAGRYRIEGVEPGLRTLRVTHLGHADRELRIYLPDGAEVRIEIRLEPRPIALPHLWVLNSTESLLPGASLGGRSAVDVASREASAADARLSLLPGGPDYLAALTGGSVIADPESPAGLHVRGSGAGATGVLIDGAPVLVPFHAGGAFSSLSPDAIAGVDLAGAVPSAARGGSLSGPVELHTASPPRDRFRYRGSISPHAVRSSLAGPVGSLGIVASARRVDPTLLSFSEPAGTGVDATDLFAKIGGPLATGRLELFGFWMRDRVGFAPYETEELDAATSPLSADQIEALRGTGASPRNRFGWSGYTASAAWTSGEGEGPDVRVQGWVSGLDARSRWLDGDGAALDLESTRSLAGVRVEAGLGVLRGGLVFQSDESDYATADIGSIAPTAGSGTTAASSAASGAAPAGRAAEAPQRSLAGFVEARPSPAAGWELSLGLRGSVAEGRPFMLEPRLATRLELAPAVHLSAGFARTVQDVQSLRNPELLTAGLFVADPSLNSRRPDVPAARSTEVAAAIDLRPLSNLSTRIMAYDRRLDGLVLIGPTTSKPFAPRPDGLGIGRGHARGLELSTRWRGGPWWAGVEYGLASVTRTLGETSYRPSFSLGHSLAADVAFSPSDDVLLHASLVVSAGRRTTAVRGLGEWEPCNHAVGGCEITGLPEPAGAELNSLYLPPYVRLDLGVRKGWSPRLFGRTSRVEAFLRLGNVTNRENILGYTLSAATSELAPIGMMPLTAVTAGLDWSF